MKVVRTTAEPGTPIPSRADETGTPAGLPADDSDTTPKALFLKRFRRSSAEAFHQYVFHRSACAFFGSSARSCASVSSSGEACAIQPNADSVPSRSGYQDAALHSPLGRQVHLALVQHGPEAAAAVAREAGQPDSFARVTAVASEAPSPASCIPSCAPCPYPSDVRWTSKHR
jgi:hypothetical protein